MTPRRSKERTRRTVDAALGLDLDEVAAKLSRGERVRRTLIPWGRLHIDRPLPFLCVYRRPPGSIDPLAEQLVTSEPSYLLAPGDATLASGVTRVAQAVTGALERDFGACLVVEISLRPPEPEEDDEPPAVFRIVRPRGDWPGLAVDELETALNRMVFEDFPVSVDVRARSQTSARGLRPLLRRDATGEHCFVVGLEIAPVYLDPERKGRDFPLVHRRLRRGLSRALKRAAFEFTTEYTTQRPPHYHALGRRSFVKAVWDVDKQLAEVSNRIDVLLLTTPRNTEQAWKEFRRARFQKPPRFSYRPIPFDPALAKRELFAIPIERIEDPTLADLFREQQDELDRKISMVADRGTPRFKHDSQQLFGGVTDALLKQAVEMLDQIPSRTREGGAGKALDARAFAARAEEELKFLRESHPGLHARVQIRRDVSGLMVSRGNLLVARHTSVPAARVDALLQHEVGTHIVTYYNGDAQPFRQLRNGLPAYEELQEGLAVLAEYMVGGLSRARLRLLAARVVAVRMMLDGASFVDVFRELDRGRDFGQRSAYTTTMRVFRGGGQAKDAVYLRGLAALLKHLGSGGKLEPLLVGKIGLHHLPIVRELEHRQVLVPPPLRPRYLGLPEAVARLRRLRDGASVLDLAEA